MKHLARFGVMQCLFVPYSMSSFGAVGYWRYVLFEMKEES
jgi:hypothetical protein